MCNTHIYWLPRNMQEPNLASDDNSDTPKPFTHNYTSAHDYPHRHAHSHNHTPSGSNTDMEFKAVVGFF